MENVNQLTGFRDEYTREHSERVAGLGVAIVGELPTGKRAASGAPQ
jgi:hypothetical protein